MTRLPIAAAASMVVFSLAINPGCHTSRDVAGEQSVSSLSGSWVLDSIEGQPVSQVLPAGMQYPSISVQPDGKLTGFGGVNRLSSSLDLSAAESGTFKITPMISTKMAGPPEAMSLESRFVNLLSETRSFNVSTGTLRLSNARGEIMVFNRKP